MYQTFVAQAVNATNEMKKIRKEMSESIVPVVQKVSFSTQQNLLRITFRTTIVICFFYLRFTFYVVKKGARRVVLKKDGNVQQDILISSLDCLICSKSLCNFLWGHLSCFTQPLVWLLYNKHKTSFNILLTHYKHVCRHMSRRTLKRAGTPIVCQNWNPTSWNAFSSAGWWSSRTHRWRLWILMSMVHSIWRCSGVIRRPVLGWRSWFGPRLCCIKGALSFVRAWLRAGQPTVD